MNTYIAVSSIILSTILYALGSGINTTYMAQKLVLEGFGNNAAALLVTASAFGQMLGCILGGQLVKRVGHIRAFSIYCVGQGIITFLLPLYIDPIGWSFIRFIQGFCATATFAITTSWLNSVTPSHQRGGIMTFFYVCFTLSFGAGAYLLSYVTGLEHYNPLIPYVLGGAFFCLGLFPIAATKMEAPPISYNINVDFKLLWRLSPAAFVAIFGAGALGLTFIQLAPVYGLALGLSESIAIQLVVAYSLGNIFIQWPLGYLSDRTDRRYVMLFALSVVMVFCGLLMFANYFEASIMVLFIIFGVLGGHIEVGYSLASAHANDHASQGEYDTVANTILIMWALGASISPILVTYSMDVAGPAGFPGFGFIMAVLLIGTISWRVIQRKPPEQVNQEDFTAHTVFPAATAFMEAYTRDELDEETSDIPEAPTSEDIETVEAELEEQNQSV